MPAPIAAAARTVVSSPLLNFMTNDKTRLVDTRLEGWLRAQQPRQLEKLGDRAAAHVLHGDRQYRCYLWSRLGSNQRPSACEADALPLSHGTGAEMANDVED